MRRFQTIASPLMLAVALASYSPARAGAAKADLILEHGHVYTQNPAQASAEAVAIAGGRILAVGSDQAIARYRRPATRVVDLKGQTVLPGFIDAHVHLNYGGGYLIHVGLREARKLADVRQLILDYVRAHPGKGWILGEGWSYGYPEMPGGLPTRQMLDAIVPDRPIYLGSAMAHAGWVNSKALEVLGITAATPDPKNGSFVRDAQGVPTGLLKESAADYVAERIPPLPASEKAEALRAAMREAARLGITRLVSGGGDWDSLPQLARWERAGTLRTRLSIAYWNPPVPVTDAFIAQMKQARARYHSDWLQTGAIKFFADGVIESHTAYLPEGYADQPQEHGQRNLAPEAMNAAITRLNREGFQVYVHAIGDGAIKETLDAFEAAQQAGAPVDLRNRIEHYETPYPADIARLARLHVVASMQPVMIYPKDEWMGMEGMWQRYAGDDRMKRAFALRQVLDAGGALAFGTDWPVSSLVPLRGIRNAVVRQSHDGEPAGGYLPAERLSVAEAIRAYTIGAAYASHRDTREGSIEPGKLADLVVLSQDITRIAPTDIDKAQVVLTLVGGKVTYRAP